MTERSQLGPQQARVLGALRKIGGRGTLRDIVASYIAHECTATEQAELEEDEGAWGRVYDNTANALKNLKKGGHVANEGGVWRLSDIEPSPELVDRALGPLAPRSQTPRGWRQQRVLGALLGLGGTGTLQAVVAGYVAGLTEAERTDFELDPSGWEREYDSIASALSNLRRAGYVTNLEGRWRIADGAPIPAANAAGRPDPAGTHGAPPSKTLKVVDANKILDDAIGEQGIDFARLVAATAIWAPVPQPLPAEAAFIVRRAQTPKGEKPGMKVEEEHPGTHKLTEVRLDSNNYANVAIKKAIGNPKGLVGFETCHIWPRTCYDVRYHTLVTNLVLLPRAIAGLSDHDKNIEACLKYRAFELFGWYPAGEAQPAKPSGYPDNWR